MSTQVTKLLTDAKLLISDKANWTKSAYAKDDKGRTVECFSEEATCFCSLGALHRASGTAFVEHTVERDAINILHESIPRDDCGWRSIAVFNDAASRTHEEVMKVWDDAIAAAALKGV